MTDRELLTAKQIAAEFHMRSAAVARGWVQRWRIPVYKLVGDKHEHHYLGVLVRLVRRLQGGGKSARAFLNEQYLPMARTGADSDALRDLLLLYCEESDYTTIESAEE